jgi:hypothetical protein
MWIFEIIKKYNQKTKILNLIFEEYKRALEEKDFVRTNILSNRFLKIK